MVRSELLQKMCNLYPNIIRKDLEKIIEYTFTEIIESLREGGNIEIRGFGTFKTKIRKARIGRNPKTKEQTVISARRVIKFKPSDLLKRKINK